MSLKPYPEYRDSGIKWLGEVPTGWEVARLKNVLAQKVTDGPHTTPVFTDEGIPFLSVDGIQDGELKFDTCRYVSPADHVEFSRKASPRRNDILMGKAASTGKIARVKVSFNFSIWSPLALIRINQSICVPRFAEYWLKGSFAQAQIDTLCTNNTQKNISMDDIPRVEMYLPPIADQLAIADYLDRETAEIEAFIADQEELIALLAERRTATIAQAVTKGLNPDAPMKDSGVEWVGGVPAHWHISKLGHHYEVVLGKMLDGAKEAPSGARMLPYVRAGNIQDAGLDLSDVNEMAYTAYEAERLNLIAKDLLVVEGGSVGTVHYLSEAMDGWSFQKTVNRVRSLGSADTKYLGHLIRMLRDSEVFEVICNGSTIMHLTAEKLRALLIPVPPVEEQCSIAAFIDRETAEIDTTIAEAREAIALSKERRAAVISAAVTGKIDVRGLMAPASMVEGVSVGVA